MKKFLRHTILFSVILLLIAGSLVALSFFLIGKKGSFVLKPAAENVFFGYSHVQFAIIDEYVPKSRNLGERGESYFFTYLKARKLLPANPGIKNVFIEVSNKQVNAYMDSAIWGDYYIQYRIPKFIAVMPASELKLLMRYNPSGVLSSLSGYPRQCMITLKRSDEDVMTKMEWGGSLPMNGHVATRKLATVKRDGFDADTLDLTISPDNIRYLHKVVDLCRSLNMKVWFWRAPAHPASGLHKNEKVFKNVLKQDFSDIPFLDFMNLSFPLQEYYDLGHINKKGAIRFSRYLGQVTPLVTTSPAPVQQQTLDSIWRTKYEVKQP